MQELAIMHRLTAAVRYIDLLLFPPVPLTLTKLPDQWQSPPRTNLRRAILSAGCITLPRPVFLILLPIATLGAIRFELVLRTDSIALTGEMKYLESPCQSLYCRLLFFGTSRAPETCRTLG